MGMRPLEQLLSTTIPPGARILYLGDNGAALAGLEPSLAVVLHTGEQSPDIRSFRAEPYSIAALTAQDGEASFDYVIMDDMLPYIDDVFLVFRLMRSLCHNDSKLIMSEVKKLTLARRCVGLFVRETKEIRNWVPEPLVETLLYLSDFTPRPKVATCLIADALEPKPRREYSYSIMIPCYNEQGNIAECIRRIPDLGRDCEIIVVNDGSTDDTAAVVRGLMGDYPQLKLIDYGENRGKGYATRCGLEAATKEVLIILDADMTVRPEDLPLFIQPFESRHAEFVNGTRLVYPVSNRAMGPVHMFGNKVFSRIFTYLLNQKVTDTLCGTKCLLRRDFRRITMKDDAWPDFDLLFGASRLNLKIVEIPIRYQPRLSGESKMRTFKHGMMLLKESFRGFLTLKLRIGSDGRGD